MTRYQLGGLEFDWDDQKAVTNEAKHGVTFIEASTAFLDGFGERISDIDHSEDENRFLLLAASYRLRILVVAHTARDSSIRIIGARVATPRERRRYAEPMTKEDEIRDEYDFSQSKRASYATLAGDVHLVAIDGDVWRSFPDSEAVNNALRRLIATENASEKMSKAS